MRVQSPKGKNTRWIIVDPEEGIFLGTKSENYDSKGSGIIALFSAENIFDITKAVSFESEKEAKNYMKHHITFMCPAAYTVPVKSNEEFVDVVDLIKSGYGTHALDMMDALPMKSLSVH